MPDNETDFVNDWMEKITLGERFKERYAKPEEWKNYRDYYRNEWEKVGDEPVLNIVYSTGKALIPRVYFRTPTVTVTPRRPEFALHARVVEAVDNWLLRELKVKKQLKRVALDAYLCGTGCVKIGYDSEFGFIPSQSIDRDTSTATQYGKKGGDLIEYKTFIKPGLPWALRCRPDEIVTPFGYDDVDSMPWICHKVWRTLDDVKNDTKYNKTIRNSLQGGYTPNVTLKTQDPQRPPEFRFNEREPYVLLYEIRDSKKHKLYVFGEDRVLLDLDDDLQVEGLPFEFLTFSEDPTYFWGTPEVKYIMEQQKELNEIKAIAFKNRRYNILKWLFKLGSMDKDTLDKLMSDSIEDIGVAMGVRDETVQSAIMPLQPHNLTSDLEKDKQMVLSDHREVTGFSRNQTGEYIPMTSKTATEAQIVQQGAEIRIDERRDSMADLLVNVVSRFNQLIFKYWTKERVVEIAGPDGARQWIKYTGDQLKGEYFLSIDPDSSVPVSRRLRYEQAFKLLEAFRGDPQIDQLALKKIVLNQFEWIDPTACLLAQEPTAQMTPGQGPLPGMPGSTPRQGVPFEQALKNLQGRMGPVRGLGGLG